MVLNRDNIVRNQKSLRTYNREFKAALCGRPYAARYGRWRENGKTSSGQRSMISRDWQLANDKNCRVQRETMPDYCNYMTHAIYMLLTYIHIYKISIPGGT